MTNMAVPVGRPPRPGAREITPRPATSATTRPHVGGGETDPAMLSVFVKFLESQGFDVTKRADGLPRRCLGDFFKCVADTCEYTKDRRYTDYEARKRLEITYASEWTRVDAPVTVEKASLGEGHGQVGGYTVPIEFSLAMMDALSEESFVYPRASVFPMGSKELLLPKPNAETAQSANTAPYFGGLLFKWGSAQAPAETEPTFGQLTLNAWDLLGYCVLSNQFLADTGPAGEAAIVKLLGKAAAYYAELAFFQGAGINSNMPLGIINAPGTISVSRHQSSHIQIQDVATMVSKLLPYSWRRALWATAPGSWVDLAQIATFLINEYSGADDGHTGSLLGRPVFTTDKLATLGSAGDLVLFDPSLYVVGNRQEVIVDVSTHDAFKNNQTTFKTWLRLDSKPWNSTSITLRDGSSTASPFVMLT